MMRKTQVILIDDLDGSSADRTIQFSLNGSAFEIDLSEANAQRLEKAMAPFIDKASKVTRGARKGQRPAVEGRSFSQAVRLWAKEQGITVPDRGRVPNGVIDQYNAAH
ncbi:Lsr2 family protein [Tessaracoccus rhinocerotis]|uniref:Lsr2 family protein n=1 Tax=Tessaracoccus rhinocerotis TaxID=1689449 RepID=A0A553K407_9ACTN|nr:Lsr2 family protein [Tessaracoccus rhinocerotis]TRY19431.1 Lsr2 family protein [Tessaracoccus rhinocerotis]